MCTVAHGMGSGWEQHIARLIDQAHETLSSSAYSRRHHQPGSAPSPYSSLSSPYRGSSTTPLRSAPTTFRGDRGASYRRGSEGWDESSFVKESSGGGGGCPSPLMAPPPPPFSRLAGARVHDARIDGLEDRVKLEVQTVVRRDVDHRVSIAERAVEHLRHRVEELTEEVSSLGEVFRKCNASTKSHTGTLEQILADEERSRSTLGVLEKWRADREGWCARTDDSLTSLSENARALTRRAHTQQKTLDEAAVEQEDLAASLKSARKAGDAAAASAVAPVRELFLQEIGTIRRRLLALEEGATEPVIPQATRALVKATAEDVAAAKGEELRTAMEAHVRAKVARGAEEAAAASVTAKREIERRLAEVERWLGTCDSALGTLRRSGREASADVPGLQDDMSALKQQLADGLSRMDDLCQRRLREARQAAQQQALKFQSDRAAVTQDLDDRLKKLEELERLGPQPPSVDIAPAVAAPSASMEKVEELADTVRELVSGAASTNTRQENSENRMEELSEQLCGHSLKLSCLEALWREPKGVVKENKAPEEAKDADSNVTTAISGASASRRPEPQTQQQQQQQQQQKQKQPEQQLRVGAGEGYVPSLTTPIRAGLSGFLKRLGSTSASSWSASQGEVEIKSGDKSGAATGTRRESSAETEPNDDVPLQDVSKQSAGLEGGRAALEVVSGAPPDQGYLAKDTQKDISRGDEVSDEDVRGTEKPGDKASDTSAGPIHRRRPSSGDSSSSAETIDGSGAREDTISASGSSSRERTPPDENAALPVGRAAQQALSEGGDGERSRGVDATLPASDEKGTPSSDNAEEATDAEITGSIEHKRKDAQDASMAQDTSTQSQREGNEGASELAQIETEAESSASESHAATAAAKEGKGAQEGEQIVRQAADLEMSGSVAGSEHSRWSLPSGGGIGGIGGVREERAVWSGLADAEDSMGSAEQAPSSISGGRGADGKSPRSRVESYDLQQEEGDDYMVPFSPDRDSLAESTSKSSPGISSSPSKISGGDSRETPPDDTPGIVASSEEVNTVADGEVDAATETTPPQVAAVSSAPEPAGIVGGGALSAVQSFCFSDDDDDDNDFMMGKAAAESERLSTPFTASTAKGDGLEGSNAESVGDGGSDRGGGSDSSRSGGTDGIRSDGRGGESLRADGSSDPIQTGSGDSGEQSSGRQSTERRPSSRLIPNPVGFDSEKSSEADRSSPVEGEGLGLTLSTPATAGTWSHPDFGFSSDDELNIDLSSSGVSSSRQAEGKGEGELTPPPSSSPIQGSYDGFDSSSVAS